VPVYSSNFELCPYETDRFKLTAYNGWTENAGPVNCRNWKMTDQNVGLEILKDQVLYCTLDI